MSCGYPCGPSCVIPTCVPSYSPSVSYPIGGLGSLSSCGIGGGVGSSHSSYGRSTSASSLGIVPGAAVGCVTQCPSSGVLIQRAPCVVTFPGPILSTTCEPTKVGGYSACSPYGSSGVYLSSGLGVLGRSRRGY